MSLRDDFLAAMDAEDPLEAWRRFVRTATKNGVIWMSPDLWRRLVDRGIVSPECDQVALAGVLIRPMKYLSPATLGTMPDPEEWIERVLSGFHWVK